MCRQLHGLEKHREEADCGVWEVRLSDNGFANGTFVSGHGAAGPWLPVAPNPSVTLAHGDRLRLGERQLLFDTCRETVVPPGFR